MFGFAIGDRIGTKLELGLAELGGEGGVSEGLGSAGTVREAASRGCEITSSGGP